MGRKEVCAEASHAALQPGHSDETTKELSWQPKRSAKKNTSVEKSAALPCCAALLAAGPGLAGMTGLPGAGAAGHPCCTAL